MKEKNTSGKNLFRTAALTILLFGTIGSLYFMFNAGSNQKSMLLLGLFTTWVLSPFIGLYFTDRLLKRWADKEHSWFYWTMIIVTIISVIAYSGALKHSETRPAFNFLVVPFFSWVVILTILLIAKRLLRKSRN